MDTSFGGGRLEHPIIPERSHDRAASEDHPESIDQPQPITPLGQFDVDRCETHAEASVLAVAKTALNCPAATVVPRHLLRAGIGAAGGQTRGLLHLRILNADHAAYPVAIGGEIGAAQHTGSSAGLYPLSRGGGLHGGAGRSDIAAEANDEVKIQLFSSDFGNL